MVIALSPDVPREVVVESDKGSATPTVFLVKPPTHGWVEAKPLADRKSVEIATAHLVGWRGLHDASGAEIEWPGSAAKALPHLPLSVVGEIATAALRMTFLEVEEKGK